MTAHAPWENFVYAITSVTMPVVSGAEAVDRDAATPPRLLDREVTARHARLRQRERREDADDVQLDQGIQAAREGPDQQARQGCQDDDSVGEDQAVAAVRELARHESVAGQDRGQARKVLIGGVRRQDQDRGGEYLDDVEAEAAAEHGERDLTHGRAWPGPGGTTPCTWTASHEMPRNIVIDITPMTARVVAALRDCGCLNAGTPFEIASTPVRAVEPEEKAWSTTKRPRGAAVWARSAIGGV